MVQSIFQFLQEHGFSDIWATILANIAGIALILVISAFAYLLVKRILYRMARAYSKISKNKWDTVLLNRKLFARIARLAPAIIIHVSAPAFPDLRIWIQRLAYSYLILTIILVLFSLLDEVGNIYRNFAISRERPIKGFLQVIKILLTVVGTILIVSALIDRSPWALLSGIGVFSAVLMLIFQNTILGFVAGIQLSGNDMVRVGDWIEMPKYNADGEVMDITLHTVKVQNGDKTISMIPAQAMITDSFKNWRGIAEAGGRRIKRSVTIDMNSICFCTDEMLDRFEGFHYLTDYIRLRRKEIEEYNRRTGADPDQFVNGRRMTNIGVFRAYVQAYLKNNQALHKDMTLLVRQLAPSQYGLPMEIYCFTRDTDLTAFESVQADIFDHILAVLPQFDLRIFQNPTGKGIVGVTEEISKD